MSLLSELSFDIKTTWLGYFLPGAATSAGVVSDWSCFSSLWDVGDLVDLIASVI